jgi:hypothetical protein
VFEPATADAVARHARARCWTNSMISAMDAPGVKTAET